MATEIQLKAPKTEHETERLTAKKGNNVLKFKRANLSIDNGVLRCNGKFGLFQFWPFPHGKKNYEIDLTEIAFIDAFPFGFFRKGVDISYGNDDELILTAFPTKKLDEFIELLKRNGVKNRETEEIELKQSRFTKKTLRMEGEYLVFRKYKKRGRMIDYSKPEKVIYFDKGNSILGGPSVDFGSLAGGGSDNSIFIDNITSNQVKNIHEFLLRHGSKLADIENAKRFKSKFPITKPKRWISSREVLGFTDNGILHIQHKLGKSRSSFLPYNTIKVISSEGVICKRILLQGATTIATIEKFSPGAWEEIKNLVGKYGIKINSVTTFRPVLALFSKNRRGITLNFSDDGIIYKYKKETSFLKNDQISKYRKIKPHWYSWFGDVVVEGLRRDARAGEGGSIKMELPHIGFFRWRKIKKMLKSRKK